MSEDLEDLPDLDPSLAEYVRAYETETARDATQVEAALQHVTTQVAAGSGAAAAGGMSAAGKLGLVVLVAVVAAIGVAVLVPGGSNPDSDRPAVDVARADATVSPVIDGPASDPDRAPRTAPVITPPEPAPAPSPAVPDDSTANATGGSAKSKARPRARPDPVLETESGSSLKAELELLRRARTALRGGRAKESLDLIRKHQEDFPNSTIAEERDATEVSTLCALGRDDEARNKAEAFGRRFPASNRDVLGDCN